VQAQCICIHLFVFIVSFVQMTSEWREIDFADADISLLGVMKIADVCMPCWQLSLI